MEFNSKIEFCKACKYIPNKYQKMQFTIKASNYELEYDWDENDPSPVPIIKFDCELNGNYLFTFLPEQGYKHWDHLAGACEYGTKYILDWGCSNGESSIKIADGNVEFCVARHGDGRGGDLTVYLPAKECVSCFRKAHNITMDWARERENTNKK